DLTKNNEKIRKLNDDFKSIYIPILRGLKPLNENENLYNYKDVFKERVSIDYGNGLNPFTGLEIFEDVKSKLLGLESDRKIIYEFEKLLEDKIFKEKVTLIPKYQEEILHIKIGDEK